MNPVTAKVPISKSRLFAILPVFFGLLAAAAPLWAHHSVSAEFIAEESKIVTVTGTLTRIEWTNPHIYFYVDAKDSSGAVVNWAFENYPPSFWRRYGLRKEMLKVGDTITVEGYPAKDGTKRLAWGKVFHLADGRTIATMTADLKEAGPQ